MAHTPAEPPVFERLAEEIRGAAPQLALEVITEGLAGDEIPSLARLRRDSQLGDIRTFIDELARQVAAPEPERLRRGGTVAALVRDHARVREALGFAPREVVTEFLLLRRILWRCVARLTADLAPDDVLVIERRLNGAVDRLITECVVAYFDRATLELAEQARRDPLTGLLNHQAFTQGLVLELERAKRYATGLSLVGLDIDRFKTINDTRGHPEGDRVLREFARVIEEERRGSDLAGRMGGDEFAVVLIHANPNVADRFLERLRARAFEFGAVSFSAGAAHSPSDATIADDLFRIADARLYKAKG